MSEGLLPKPQKNEDGGEGTVQTGTQGGKAPGSDTRENMERGVSEDPASAISGGAMNGAGSISGGVGTPAEGDLDSILASLGAPELEANLPMRTRVDSGNAVGQPGTETPPARATHVMVQMKHADPSDAPTLSAVRVDVAAAARGEAVVKSGEAETVTLSDAPSVTSHDLGGGVGTAEGVMDGEADTGPQSIGVRSLRDDAEEYARRNRMAGTGAVPEDTVRLGRTPVWMQVTRWAAVVALTSAAAYGGWKFATPPGVIRAEVKVEGMNDPTALIVSTGVREMAIAKLGQAAPDVGFGELASEEAVRAWAESAAGAQGMLVIEIPAESRRGEIAGTARERRERLRALLSAVAEIGAPRRAVAVSQMAILKDNLRGAEEALVMAKSQAADLDARAKESPKLKQLIDDATAAVAQRDKLTSQIETLKNDEGSVVDEAARKKLDGAVELFQQKLDEVKAQQGQDPKLAAFVAVVQNIQDEGASLTEAILARRQEETGRLVQLKKRLDERMKVRQQQVWDADDELKRLATQLEETKRRFDATDPGNLIRRQELKGEIDYLDGLIKSRKVQIGSDKGDQRAVAEVQAIIDEQATATEQDRKKLADSFAKMKTTLARVLPAAGSAQAKLAESLETRLTELQSARAGLAESLATSVAQREKLSKQLEADLAAAEKDALAKQAAVEAIRASLPNTKQLDDAHARVERLTNEADFARKALKDLETGPVNQTPAKPVVTAGVAEAPGRFWWAVVPGLVMLLLSGAVLRPRD